MMSALVQTILGGLTFSTCLNPPASSIPRLERIAFLGSVMECCLLQSPLSSDLEWARNHGFEFFPDTGAQYWPGRDVRAEACRVASMLPRKIAVRSRTLIRRRAYSNSEMYADLFSMYGYPSLTACRLPWWKKALAPIGPRNWELGVLHEHVSELVGGVQVDGLYSHEMQTLTKDVVAIFPAICDKVKPYFDHIAAAEVVFVPFLVPRSGFGIAPRNAEVIVAFGPGLDLYDHQMTIWHELLHFPVRRMLREILHLSDREFVRDRRELPLIEENIVAVLTDHWCPVTKPRPNMRFDGLIREEVKRMTQSGDPIDLGQLGKKVMAGIFRTHA